MFTVPGFVRSHKHGVMLAALFLGLPGTPAPAVHSAEIVVWGVISGEDGRPVQSAQITAMQRNVSAKSGADGRYVLRISRSQPREIVQLDVRASGFSPTVASVALTSDSVRANVRLSRALTRAVVDSLATVGAAASVKESRADMALRAASPTMQVSGMFPGKAATGFARDMRTGNLRHAPRDSGNTEAYDLIDENPFRSPRVAPMSTFSVDVDRASYSNVRRFLAQGQLPPKDAVRIEELVNYFPYNDAAPGERGDPLKISTEVAAAPWNPQHDLVRIALRARDVDMRKAPPSNLVFLIDVSGSMMGPGRLPLVKQSLGMLVNELRDEDRVAIVVYAGNAGLVLPSTRGGDKQRILAALDGLEAGGSTAGGAGIRLAYDVAKQNFISGGSNRVILCTDGDFNVGQSSDGELVRLIEQRRTEGSFLTILGFGMGNYKDAKMEKLAGAGNGNYGYIDDLLEARKMLVKEMGGTLLTVAKDVKLQVEFNPSRVQAYRLLGYEDRLLRDEDFANDAKDAGDVGAGHTVTALYEIVPSGAPLDVTLHDVAALRYQKPAGSVAESDELLHVAMRYKAPDGDKSSLVTHPVKAERRTASESLRFSASVAAFGMLLRDSPNRGSFTWQQQLALAKGARGADEDGYRADFIRLSETAAMLAGKQVSKSRD